MQTHKVLLRHMAVEHQGNGQQYEHFRKMIEASPLLYNHDFHFFNDSISLRHSRNIAEVKYIKQLLNENKIIPEMLKYNVFNSFYPSYILDHHYSIFMPLLHKLRNLPEIAKLLKVAKKNQITGALFHETRNLQISNQQIQHPQIDDQGLLRMRQKTYFYSLVTSPYITHAAFMSYQNGVPVLTIVALRDENGEFCKGVNVVDFGATISSDYLPVGYHLSGVKPQLFIALQPKMIKGLEVISSKQLLNEFSYSLRDYQKSLWITIRYTSMRRQFKTLANSKEERRIITYQAVAARIIDGFAQFEALANLKAKIMSDPNRFSQLDGLLHSAHHIILEQLIYLRECCGGFGFMQVSGHPGCIERVCNRAGNQPLQHFKTARKYLKALQFYTGSEQLEQFFMQQVVDSPVPYMQYFSVFLSICKNMREHKELMRPQEYRREFLKQTSIFAMHSNEEFSRHQGSNVHCQLLWNLLLGYIYRNARFIEWGLLKIDRQAFFEQLSTRKAVAVEQITKELSELGQTLELTYLRNTILGRENEQEFYQELLLVSKGNLRNSKEFREYVREPIAQMVTANRAKL